MKFLIPLAILFLTSCGKTIMFEKIVVNDSDQEITVSAKDCDCLDEAHVIAPRSTDTLGICGWSPVGARPSREDVENRFQITSDKTLTKKIEDGNNWTLVDNDNTVTCTFTVRSEDFVE